MKFRLRTSLLLGFILASALALPAQAMILDADEKIFFDEFVTEDVYLAGEDVTISEDVEGDLFVASANVTVNGNVSGDVFIASGNALINGNVGDDLRAAGGSILLNGNVEGDVLVAGGTLEVSRGVNINGDVAVASGNVNLYGTVNRSVQGILGKLTIGGTINGDVEAKAFEELVLLEQGTIAGNVTYFSPRKIEDHGGKIGGEVFFNEIASKREETQARVNTWVRNVFVVGQLWAYFSLLLIGGLAAFFMPHFLQRTTETIKAQPLWSFGVGFLAFILAFLIALISLFTFIGVPLALMIFALLFILVHFGKIVAGYFVGSLLFRKEMKRNADRRKLFGRTFLTLAVGLLVLQVVGLIPVLGWLVSCVLFLIGAGALLTLKRNAYHHLLKERMI